MSSDVRRGDGRTTIVLVAVEVPSNNMVTAQALVGSVLSQHMKSPGSIIDSWWIAEDERYDGSDNDSAVFVPMGQQRAWSERVAGQRDAIGFPLVTFHDGGLEVINEVADRPMFGVVTEESPEQDEADCYDYVLGHWPNGEEWVELGRWPVEWSIQP